MKNLGTQKVLQPAIVVANIHFTTAVQRIILNNKCRIVLIILYSIIQGIQISWDSFVNVTVCTRIKDNLHSQSSIFRKIPVQNMF
jgi:hypothetical protein